MVRFIKKLSNTGAELKKGVVYIKKRVSVNKLINPRSMIFLSQVLKLLLTIRTYFVNVCISFEHLEFQPD